VNPEQLHAASCWRDTPFDAEWAEILLDLGRKGERGFDLIQPEKGEGFLLMATAPSHFNPDFMLSMELAWAGGAGVGKTMIDAAKAKAKERGSSVLLMGAENDIRGRAMGRLYRSWGGTPHSASYKWAV